MKKIFLFSFLFAFIPKISLAHCPLCTAGAGALAVLAASMGVSSVVVGLTIGAFAISLAMWTNKLVKKNYFSFQSFLIISLVFASVILPIMPLIKHYGPLYISFWGDYGTVFHNTYTINLFLAGVPLGVIILLVSPYISKSITKYRDGKVIPYQGIIITFSLIIVISMIIQLFSL